MPNESRILEIGSYGLARRGRLKDLFFTLLSAVLLAQYSVLIGSFEKQMASNKTTEEV